MTRISTLALAALACLATIPSIAEARYRDGMNLYQYVHSNPVNYLDPMGLRRTEHPVPKGKFVVDMTPTPPQRGPRGTIPTEVKGTIEFIPDAKKCPECKLIRLVQIVYVKNQIWRGAEANREFVKTKKDKKKGIRGGFFVDHMAANCEPGKACSIYYRVHAPHEKRSHDGSNDGKTPVGASLYDGPKGGPNESMEFETCARCVDDGEYFGCVIWSWLANKKGEIGMRKPHGANLPSATFNEAIRVFNEFY